MLVVPLRNKLFRKLYANPCSGPKYPLVFLTWFGLDLKTRSSFGGWEKAVEGRLRGVKGKPRRGGGGWGGGGEMLICRFYSQPVSTQAGADGEGDEKEEN